MQIINYTVLNNYIELVGEDKRDMLLGMFIDDINDRSRSLVESSKDNDENTRTRELHTLKSVSRTIGALSLGDLIETLEEKSRENKINQDEIQECLNKIIELISELKDIKQSYQ